MFCLNHSSLRSASLRTDDQPTTSRVAPVTGGETSSGAKGGGRTTTGSPGRAFARRIAGAVLALALAGVAVGSLGCSRDPGPNDFEVRMTISILPGATGLGVRGFSPNPAVCTRGTLVLWTNDDTVDHRIVSTGGFFDSGVIKPGQSYQKIFRDLGNYRYHDELTGSSSQGVLNVID